jgi:signal transduction histidine kinase
VTTLLLRCVINTEPDVFTVRRQGRQLGAALGLEGQDQIRIAAALSEVGRRLLAEFGHVVLEFALDRSDPPMLNIRATAAGPADDALIDGVSVTRPLVDAWELHTEDDRTAIELTRRLPAAAAGLTPDEIGVILADVGALTAGTPIEELAEHNRQLLATLEQVQAQRDDLVRLNAELEETNKGVVALYNELSEELEATNRGVVALYAELEQRSEELRAASESKTRFLANVSHELRSPVTSVVGLTRLLRDAASDPLSPDQAEQLRLIDVSAHSLLDLVNELLDLAKAESGRLEPNPEPTDLKAIFDTLRGTLRAVPRAQTTNLVVADPVGVPVVVTDPILLTQVLRNLVTNGLKFTPAGEVRLAAEHDPESGQVRLRVTDTGIGIPPAEQERVFEEFHQVRNEIQATVSGTGLGLPYARRLVHILGGSITLQSTVGQGSTFTVLLPLKPSTVDNEDTEPLVDRGAVVGE